jgi:hypothetical protein
MDTTYRVGRAALRRALEIPAQQCARGSVRLAFVPSGVLSIETHGDYWSTTSSVKLLAYGMPREGTGVLRYYVNPRYLLALIDGLPTRCLDVRLRMARDQSPCEITCPDFDAVWLILMPMRAPRREDAVFSD